MPVARYYFTGETVLPELVKAAEQTGLKVREYHESPPDYAAFGKRKVGKKLCEDVQRGDYIILPSLIGTFYASNDCVARVRAWLELGVRVQLLNPPLDSGTEAGNAILQWVLFGIGDARRMQRPPRPPKPKKIKRARFAFQAWGWKAWRRPSTGARALVPNEPERVVGRLVQQLHAEGFNWRDIARQLALKNIRYRLADTSLVWFKPREAQSLWMAAEHGFPRVPRAVWLTPERETWLHRVKDDVFQPPPGWSPPQRTDRGQSAGQTETEAPE